MCLLGWIAPGEARVSYDVFHKIQLGMPRPRVAALLGAPDAVRYDGDFRTKAYYYDISGPRDLEQGFLVFDASGKVAATGVVFFPGRGGAAHQDLARGLARDQGFSVLEEGENYTVLTLRGAPVYAVVQNDDDGAVAVYVMTEALYGIYCGS